MVIFLAKFLIFLGLSICTLVRGPYTEIDTPVYSFVWNYEKKLYIKYIHIYSPYLKILASSLMFVKLKIRIEFDMKYRSFIVIRDWSRAAVLHDMHSTYITHCNYPKWTSTCFHWQSQTEEAEKPNEMENNIFQFFNSHYIITIIKKVKWSFQETPFGPPFSLTNFSQVLYFKIPIS